jgi:type I restriction enzyme S subunit
MYVLRPETSLVVSRYLFYFLLSHPFVDFASEMSMRVAMPKINRETLGAAQIPVPPIAKQHAIAAFLDRETAKIDALIAKQQHLAAALIEHRDGLATTPFEQVIGTTEGTRLKSLCTVIDERLGDVDNEPPLLSVSIHWGVRRRDEITDDLPRAEDRSNYKTCRPGDIVVNRMRAFQGALGICGEDGIASPDYLVLRTEPGVDPHWLATVMRSRPFVADMTSRIRGVGSITSGVVRTPRINADDLGQIRIDLPTLEQQHTTVRA